MTLFNFVSKRVRHREHPAIHHRSSRSGCDGLDMTNAASDILEEPLACLRIGHRRNRHIARWLYCPAHELGQVIDVRHP
jgi:hypothetical protein